MVGLDGHKKSLYVFCVLITIIGFWVRWHGSSVADLWYDEAIKLSAVHHAFFSWQDFISHHEAETPLYLLVLKFYSAVSGMSEQAVRLPSIVCGALSVLGLFFVGRFLFNIRIGCIAALLLLMSPFHVYYSQQNLNYSLFGLLSIASTLAYIQAVTHTRMRYLIVHACTILLLCMTHLFGFYVCVVHWGGYLYYAYKKRISWQWLIVQGTVAIGCFLWIIFALYRGASGNDLAWISPPSFLQIYETLTIFTYGGNRLATGGEGFVFSFGSCQIMYGTLFIFLLLFGRNVYRCMTGKSSRQERFHFMLLSFICVYPLVVTYVFSILFFPLYVSRYFMGIYPAFLLLFALMITQVKRTWIQYGLVVGIAICQLNALGLYYSNVKQSSWHDIALYAQEQKATTSLIMVLPLKQIVPFMYYYAKNPSQALREIDTQGKRHNKEWASVFSYENTYFAGAPLGESVVPVLFHERFLTYMNDVDRIIIIESPYWPRMHVESGSYAVEELSRHGWQLYEDKMFAFPGVHVYCLMKEKV